MQKFSNIKVDQLTLINPLIRTTTLELVKKNNKQGHVDVRKFKNKKMK